MVERVLSHRRNIECLGYERSDGLWDIEAHLTDVKGFELGTPDRELIATDEFLHDMSLCLTIDLDMKIHAAKAELRDTPYQRCPKVADQYQQLVGLTIGAGWKKALAEKLGGTLGCTHLREILGPMATVAYQTITDAHYRKMDYRDNPQVFKPLVDSCYGLSSKGDVIARLWPEFVE